MLIIGNLALHELQFADSLENTYWSPNRLKGTFKDYVRFRPSRGVEAENIYVTLGIIRWEIHAVAERDLAWFTWHLATDHHPAPTGPDNSDEFPQWTSNRSE
jgi:hypothetical protein